MVTIAYWDTQGGSRPPRLLGDFQGTPTIRLFTPKRKPKKAGSVSEKTVLDYQHGERNAGDIRKFLEYQIPSYVERVKFGAEDYDKLRTKAERFGLPLVVVFTTKTKTSTTLKWLSAEYRRRILMVEVPPSDKNEGLEAERFADLSSSGGDDEDTPTASLYVVPPDGGPVVRYEGGSFARRKLHDFLKQHALSKIVLEDPSKKKEEKEEEAHPPPPKHDEF
mmetsp:Transcript_25967/g.60950  ORF Transcript_25967/g.60950 Transcript_25967/m.60950 type:complete len:221 (+) Transcript_25967:492-1154(+)